MRRILTFDADADAYEVASETKTSLRALPGVLAVEVLTAVGSRPTYCVLLETDDAKDEEVARRINADLSSYAGYLSNVSHRAFKKVG